MDSTEALVLRQEFLAAILVAVGRLPPIPRDLFVHFHLCEEEFLVVVGHSGKSPNAVKQSLFRSRQQVRLTLLRQGVSENDLSLF